MNVYKMSHPMVDVALHSKVQLMVDLMLDLNGSLRVLFESNWRCTIKWQRGCTWRFTWFKHEHVSAVESVPDGLSEDTPTFEVEIKGAIKVAIEFHLKMLMVVHFLVLKCSQNSSIKGEHEAALYATLEGAPKISL